ncbi:MAG: ferritin [Ectothiorhodospiraceae bacterium]|nr:ferritin [Ectothiorhodospiraceae bacterium]
MLSASMLEKLNEQIRVEFESSNIYLQMSSWCAMNNYNGAADFLLRHSEEERQHMMKLFDYVNETGAMATVPALAQPKHEYESLLKLFEETLEHEKFVTSRINALVDSALTEKDFSTFNFLQWYVAEQHEEEHLFSDIVDKIKLIGMEGRGLFLIDKEIGKMGFEG